MPELAAELERSIGWQPVLWIGHAHLESRVHELFPGTPWQRIIDAWFGRPIDGVGTEQPPALDEDWWRRMQPFIPRLVNQMNRFGPSDYFPYDEREAFARTLILRWHEALTATGVQAAFLEESPSVPFSFAAYVVCQELGIPVVSLIPTKVFALSLLREEIEAPALRVEHEYRKRMTREGGNAVSSAVQAALDGVVSSQQFYHVNQAALDDRERRHLEQHAATNGVALEASSGLMPKVLTRVRWLLTRAHHGTNVRKWPLFVRNAIASRDARRLALVVGLKKRGRPVESTAWSVVEFRRYQKRALEIKRALRADYERRCSDPDYDNDRYIYFPLHYRPERTSNPDGGVFYDQILPLQMLSEALPEGWKLYVKEHGVQFNASLYGECGRTPHYYDQIASLHGVQFIPVDTSSKDLVLHSEAVASITGTVCWEAALLGKPAMYFGFPWYQTCPGTTKVSSPQDVRRILEDPSGATASAGELLAWHAGLDAAGVAFEFNAWQTHPGRVRDEDQYEGLRHALTWWASSRGLISPCREAQALDTRR